MSLRAAKQFARSVKTLPALYRYPTRCKCCSICNKPGITGSSVKSLNAISSQLLCQADMISNNVHTKNDLILSSLNKYLPALEF